MPNSPQLPVGTQSAIANLMAANDVVVAARHQAAHAAVYQSGTYRNAALLDLADILLGDLSDAVIAALGITTAARRVLISAAQQRHAIERRQLSTQLDADLVATRLTEAVANLRFLITPQRDPRIFELVGFAPAADKCIKVPIKLVRAASAASKQDEWWVQTAIPFGVRKYRYHHARGELRVLVTGPLPVNFKPPA